MAHVISCHSCGQKSSVSDAIFEKRIAGKKVTLRCTHCREPIPVDGTKPGELRAIPPTPKAPVSPPSPVRASPPPLARPRATADHRPAIPAPPPASARPQPKATLLGLAGPPVKPPLPEEATPKAPPPATLPTPIARAEMVTVPEDAFNETTRVAAIPTAPATSPPHSPPLALAATALDAALAPVAAPPPLPSASAAPPPPTAPVPEHELTPSAVACSIELPPPTSSAGLARDENTAHRRESAPRRGRGAARVALLSAIPLFAIAAIAVGVLTTRHAIVERGKPGSLAAPSALPAVLETAAAKLDLPPPAASLVQEPETLSAPSEPSAPPAPPPAAPLAEDPAAQPPAEELAIPSYVKAPIVLHRTHLALRRAERCHPHGHAVGTAQVYVTFAPSGRVVDARLEGEPLASAPVARCLLDHARSIRLPRFKGKPFTIREPITLR